MNPGKRKILLSLMVVSLLLSNVIDDLTYIVDVDTYIKYEYLFISLSTFCLGLYPLISSFILKSCIFTKGAIILFLIKNLLNIIPYIFPSLPYDDYVSIGEGWVSKGIFILLILGLHVQLKNKG